ncbi:hypothetical protein [Haloprofundus salilacus]|uniref:hypothetical protein n=1 Tax=Haloprofundus salilacus TaxID=2876190 RepID=UPI001CCDBEA7|nr:hypothetical protein [Haloprofundus salilacus]
MTKDDRYGAAGDTYGDVPTPEAAENGTGESTNGEAADRDRDRDRASESDSTEGDAAETNGTAALPFIFARRTVKADRDALPVYVRPTTAERLDALERDLDDRFDGDDVMSLDVREAVVTAGLRNIDDVVDVMEQWGYGRR